MIKVTGILASLIFALSVSAQPFSDSLLPSKSKTLERFIPSANGKLLSAAYLLEPQDILNMLQAFSNAAAAPASDIYARKDLAFFCRNSLYEYSIYYGMDSIKYARFTRIMQGDSQAPGFKKAVDSAYKQVFIKKLSAQQKRMLDSLVFTGWDMNDWALYQRSASYRTAVDNKIIYLMYTSYDKAFGPGMPLEQMELKIIEDSISNPALKEYFAYDLTGSLIKRGTDSALISQLYQQFERHHTNEDYMASLRETYNRYRRFVEHLQAPDFNYSSIENKEVSLQSLRGKYVYIDIWATWCGPCKAEIPFLQKLEKQYEGRNIRFVSISVDKPSDKAAWQKYVKEQNLEGIQLIADNAFNSDFIRQCNVNSIPRFILIDPKGNIISGNALRPSNAALKEQLDSLTGI